MRLVTDEKTDIAAGRLDAAGAGAAAMAPAGAAAVVTDARRDAGPGAPSESMTDAGKAWSGAKAAAAEVLTAAD